MNFDKIGIKEIPGLNKMYFNRDEAKYIENYMKSVAHPESMGDLMRTFHTITNAWKITATIVNPAHHTRNYVGGMYQNFLGDVDIAKISAKH